MLVERPDELVEVLRPDTVDELLRVVVPDVLRPDTAELLRLVEVEPETVPVEGVPLRVLVEVVVPAVLPVVDALRLDTEAPVVEPAVRLPVVDALRLDTVEGELAAEPAERRPAASETAVPATTPEVAPEVRRPLIEPVAVALFAVEAVLSPDALRPVPASEVATILLVEARRPTADEIAAVLRLPPE